MKTVEAYGLGHYEITGAREDEADRGGLRRARRAGVRPRFCALRRIAEIVLVKWERFLYNIFCCAKKRAAEDGVWS